MEANLPEVFSVHHDGRKGGHFSQEPPSPSRYMLVEVSVRTPKLGNPQEN